MVYIGNELSKVPPLALHPLDAVVLCEWPISVKLRRKIWPSRGQSPKFVIVADAKTR